MHVKDKNIKTHTKNTDISVLLHYKIIMVIVNMWCSIWAYVLKIITSSK